MVPYRLDPARAQAPVGGAPYHEWTAPDGSPWAAFHRAEEGFLLRFPGFADFLVSEDGRLATCIPVPGADPAAYHHLYLNQARPLMLARQGKLVFHASVVELDRGAVGFLAASGRGKSTLAAAFAAGGARFLADDGMVLEEAAAGFRVLPGDPSLRLREDSRRALALSGVDLAGGPVLARKERLPAQARLAHCGQPRPLVAAFVLGQGGCEEIRIRRLSGVQAFAEWVGHAFILDVDDAPWLAAHFDAVSRLSAAVPCHALDYPRRFADLGRLRGAVAELVAAHVRPRDEAHEPG